MSITTQLKGYYKKGKDIALNAPEIERKVKDATSNDKWGPTGTQMQEISRATMNFHDFPIIMGVIWKRINDPGKYWRHVYKSLLLIDYLIRNGSEQVIRDCRNHLIEVQTLMEFQYIEEDKDVGLSVRERAKQVIDLLQDDKRIRTERDKAKANRDKYVGVGNEGGSRYGGFEGYSGGSGGYDSDRYGGYGNDRYSNDRYGGDNRYGGNDNKYGGYGNDNYSSGRGGNNNSDRDYSYDREEYRDENRYGRQNEDAQYHNEDEGNEQQQVAPKAVATTLAPRSRPRAPSGGETLPPPQTSQQPAKTGNLLSIDDVLSTPAPPQSHSQSLFDAFQPSQGLGQQPDNFGAFHPGGHEFSNSGSIVNNNPDFFNPRASEQAEWSDFQGPANTDNFNPFGQQLNPNAPDNEFQKPGEPVKNDPWAKKDLFNLDSLNISDKDKSKPVVPGVSPSKTPMAAHSKAPMVANKPAVASGPTIRPPTLTPAPIGFGQQGGGGTGYPQSYPQQQGGFGPGGYAQPGVPYGQGAYPPMGRGMATNPYGPPGMYPPGTGYGQPNSTPGYGQPFQQPRGF